MLLRRIDAILVWANVTYTRGVVHTIPIDDIVDHSVSTDSCICGPTVEEVPTNDGGVGYSVVHHSLDGRERYE